MVNKKFRVTGATTFGQARVRGITKKQYERRRKISISLTQTKRTGRTIKQRREAVRVPKRPVQRIRRQVAINYVDRDSQETGLVFLSVRAVTLNPSINEKGLFMALEEGKRLLQRQLGINLKAYDKSYVGVEKEEIAPEEDKQLNDFRVHVEVFYNGRVMQRYKI